ncbi:hypothetical protein G3M48_008266 [Beauveria asiatica]|uniref:Protein kinase domain-containing protein n=1 Tax=Beauveria asiatica TaxID=1069075 RepID=A0AAW0RKR3_9HYPO
MELLQRIKKHTVKLWQWLTDTFPWLASLFPSKSLAPLLDGCAEFPIASFFGSTAIFFRIQPGVVLKAPFIVRQDLKIHPREDVAQAFHAEEHVLKKLGAHPRVTEFLGARHESPSGLLFREAEFGDLQAYLAKNGPSITSELRRKWSLQCAEAVAVLHSHQVLHNDLRPDSFLIYGPDLDVCVCDFGGASCPGLTSLQVPSPGFLNPKLPARPSIDMDIFSLGSVLYTIVAGHWPFKESIDSVSCEETEYTRLVEERFANGEFPAVSGYFCGDIIEQCWNGDFSSAGQVSQALYKVHVPRPHTL